MGSHRTVSTDQTPYSNHRADTRQSPYTAPYTAQTPYSKPSPDTIQTGQGMGLTGCLGGETESMEDVLKMPCTALVNWEDIKTEIICSNVIQKNNILFARKLDKTLLAVAREGDKNAKNFDNLWCAPARRKVLYKILEEWEKENSKKTTVQKLMGALSVPGFMDVRLRVEDLLKRNCF